jgi:hypothetical protein
VEGISNVANTRASCLTTFRSIAWIVAPSARSHEPNERVGTRRSFGPGSRQNEDRPPRIGTAGDL